MFVRILIVSDSAPVCTAITDSLSEYDVSRAGGFDEAVGILHGHNDINIIIIDTGLPENGGFELLNTLSLRREKTRVLILTESDDPASEIRGLKSVADDYIRKPIVAESLKARIGIHVKLLEIQNELYRKTHEQNLAFRIIFNQAPIGIAVSHNPDPENCDNNPAFIINPAFKEITGWTRDELVKHGWAKLTHPDDIEIDLANYRKLLAGEINSYSMEKRYIKPDGSFVWVQMIVASLITTRGNSHICLVQDISKQKETEANLRESERSKSVLLSHLPGLAYRCLYDRDWTMQFVSAGCFALTGYPPESFLYNRDLSFNELIAPEYREVLWAEWERILKNREPFKYEYEIVTADGKRKWVLEMGQGIYDKIGEVEALEGIVLDISDRKKIEDSLRFSNEHDRWTGLYNRSYLENLLNEHSKVRFHGKRALIAINLGAIQALSSIYGFHYTQELIKKTADALSGYCRENCMLFNTYENRFVFYMTNYKDKNSLLDLCAKITETLVSLLKIERVGGGIGILEISNSNDRDINLMLKRLLIASERAMEISESDFGVCFYDEEIENRITREEEIKRALTKTAYEDDRGLFLLYQPILNLETHRICGFEALARLYDETLGNISPCEFIPIAEKTKLIIPIGEKIFERTLDFLKKLYDNGFYDVNISINISVIQLLKTGFAEYIIETIEKKGVSPKNIGLEITESVFTSRYEEINNIIGRLKKHGLYILIDDFGTGYSSLARESELNVNCLKIDKYFIDSLMQIEKEKAVAEDIISMAHKLGHCTVAEGVEHEAQMRYLIECGCDKIQGYLIAEPLDENSAICLLSKNALFQR